MNKSFCPSGVSFKHTAVCVQGSDISSKNTASLNDENQSASPHKFTRVLTLSLRHFLYSGVLFFFFLMWTIKDYKWTIFLAFPSSSQLCSVRRQAYARLLFLCCSVCANSLSVGALWRISRTKHEAVMFKEDKEPCARYPSMFHTLRDMCWGVPAVVTAGAAGLCRQWPSYAAPQCQVGDAPSLRPQGLSCGMLTSLSLSQLSSSSLWLRGLVSHSQTLWNSCREDVILQA